MKAVIQRVTSASVVVDGETVGSCGHGLLILLGVATGDTEEDLERMLQKIVKLRIFEDDNGKMNRSIRDIDGEMLVVSNFTLYADCSHGRRPDFFHAAKPDIAIPVYEHFLSEVKARGIPMICGKFGADMAIDHVNDGPVTIIMDTDQMMKKGV